jgi:GDP-4-dehydro-6-deoxy-D-mannose reductase
MDVDLLDGSRVLQGIEETRPDRIYHCAGFTDPRRALEEPEVALEVNLIGTRNLLVALGRVVPTARVLIPSSGHVYAESDRALEEDDRRAPSHPYAISKLAQELIAVQSLAERSLSVVIARTFNAVGPGQGAAYAVASFASQIAQIETGQRHRILRTGDLGAVRDFVDIRDTVAAYRLIMETGAPGRFYNVCSGQGRLLRDVVAHFVSLARVDVSVEEDTVPTPHHRTSVIGNPSRITRELGWSPTVPFRVTLLDTLEYWRERYAVASMTHHGA